jgi:hypothetical protein
MNTNGCFAVISILVCCIASVFLGCIITYDCAFYERECTITIDDNAYVSSTYPYISKSNGTVSFKLKNGKRVELPYKKVVIEVEQN